MLVIHRTKTVDYEMTLQLMKTGTAETNEMRTLKSLRILFLFLSETLSFLHFLYIPRQNPLQQ